MLPLIFHTEVQAEIDQAYAWYEDKRTGLGEDLLADIREVLDRIQDRPQVARTSYRDVRAVLTGRFPYVVYYRLEELRIVILAIQHGRRDPQSWRDRI